MADAHVLPLPRQGQTPRRVMTIAGSDSGGSAGLQADLRAFAMLGVHGCAAVTAVTVQNTLGVKKFHEIPVDVVAGQISAVASDIGIEAAKTGMLASSEIIRTVVATWRSEGLDENVPLVVDPVCASNVGEPLLHPSALDATRDELIPLCMCGAPPLDDTAVLLGGVAVDDDGAHDGARAPHAWRARWSRVKGCPLRASRPIAALLFGGSEFHEFTATRVETPHDHGAGDNLAAAITAALAHGYSVPEAVRFGKLWVTDCIRAAYPLGRGHGPVNGMARLSLA